MSLRRAAPRRTLVAAALLVICAAPPAAHAEFHAWIDAAGVRRISNIPPSGVRGDGSVRGSYHPYSVSAQHPRMRAELEREAAALAAAETERRRGATPRLPLAPVLSDAATAPTDDAHEHDRERR